MTKRFLYIVAIGIPIIFLTGLWSMPAALSAFILYNIFCFGLYFIDVYISPGQSVLKIERHENDILYYRADNTIEILVRNQYHRSLQVELKDEIPDWHFELKKSDMLHGILPGEESRFTYEVTPQKRGSFLFENIYIRITGVLGLCKKIGVINSPLDFKVYPDLRNLSKFRLIIQKNRLLSAGKRRVHLRGIGSEFESLREYVEGDDYRKINWMVTARENKLILNEYEAEKNQPVYIFLDTGKSMSYTIKGYKKLDYAINGALVLSDIVNQKGDNSGLLVFNTDIDTIIPPGKGDVHRNQFMEALYHALDSKNTSDYETIFTEFIAKQKRRSIVFLFTDFETEEEAKDLQKSIKIISRRHVPVVVLMVNESLRAIALGQGKNTQDLFEQGVAKDLMAHRVQIIRALNQRGVLCIETEAENFAMDVINEYLHLRERFYG